MGANGASGCRANAKVVGHLDQGIMPRPRSLSDPACAASEGPPHEHRAAPRPQPVLWKIRLSNQPLISIVDDDEAVREATKGLMRALGFLAEAFGSAEDFLKFDRLQSTACLIADVQMPHMSGLELYRRIAASGISIPTILITAYPDDGTRLRALEAGVIGYLTKPFNINDLLACIRSALDRGQAEGSQDEISE
jgi:CheY-like chemotaxis protein